MVTINLHNLHFHAFHGCYEEEKILGNSFVVNASVTFSSASKINSLDQTVNYVSIYNIIKNRMNQPVSLLETVAENIIDDIHEFDKRLNSISINIEKINPPIINIRGSVGISIIKNF